MGEGALHLRMTVMVRNIAPEAVRKERTFKDYL